MRRKYQDSITITCKAVTVEDREQSHSVVLRGKIIVIRDLQENKVPVNRVSTTSLREATP
jgi:hypothetical protein